MVKKYFTLLLVTLLPALMFAEKIRGTLALTNPAVTAVCIYDTEAKTATLGNGYTACINHYESGTLSIPGSVTYNSESYKVVIGQFAFRLCNKFTKIFVQEGVEHIADYAFVGCSAVNDIDLPSTLQTIGAGAFCNLSNLKTMRCRSTAAPTWQWNDVFSVLGTKASMKEKSLQRNLVVPVGHLADYKNSKFDGTSTGTQTGANEKVGWEEAFARIYEINNEPVEITSLAEFKAFRDAVNAGTMETAYPGREYFVLTTDITLGGESWEPIGTVEHPFSGYFDGDGHTISNLTVVNFDSPVGLKSNQGLFGYVTNAKIHDLHLKNPLIRASDYGGALVGQANTNVVISDILVTTTNTTDYTVTSSGSGGGIVGRASSATIERCMFRGFVSNGGWAGGIVGNVYLNVTVSDCCTVGFVGTSEGNRAGGIVGGAGGVNVKRCFARNFLGPLYGASVGFVAGYLNRADYISTIENCAYYTIAGAYGFGMIGYKEQIVTEPTTTGNVGYAAEADMNQDKTKAVLGTDNWYYFTDNYVDYPVPATLVDMYMKDCVHITDGDFVYQPVGTTGEPTAYEVQAYTGSATEVTIPDTYNSKPVTAIIDNVFKDNQTLTTVTLGSNLTSIGAHAFENCDALTAVDLPDAVTYVGRDAFRGCDNLASFNIGTGFQDHKSNFIAYCPKLTTLTASRGNDHGYLCVDNVLIHNAGKYRSYVIACAPGKTGNYTIPVGSLTNSTVNVFGSSFATCTGLTSVTFPAGKQYSLGKGVFDGAYNLRYVDLSAITGTIEDAKYNVDRSDPDNPFYGMSDYTFIYLPAGKGHTATLGEPNVVIGAEAQYLTLNEEWDFVPKVSPITTTYGVSLNRWISPSLVEFTEDTDTEIVIDDTETTQQDGGYNYVPTGYTCYLPYDLTLEDEDVKVYKPTSSETTAGVTTITFTQVEDNMMEAYKPYYIVVTGDDDVDLSTYEAVTVNINSNGTWSVGDYDFKGTVVEIPNTTLYDAQKPAYILQSSGKWHRVPENEPDAYVGPFRCYFQATSANSARTLSMTLDNDDATGIQQIRTIDADGTERYFDLNGRLLPGKPQRGAYILNGKKYVNK
jgi:hypothetical protein